jgi:predicted naringenin-chalcone synthase
MTLPILGLGTAAPKLAIDQRAATELVRGLVASPVDGHDRREERALSAIFRRSGVTRRHSVLLGEGANGEVLQQFFSPAVSPDDRGPGTRARMERYAAHAGALAASAGARALETAGVEAGSITHLVTVSCTGFDAPGFDIALIRELDLARTVGRTHVGFMGCHGALNGLRVANAFADANADARVLLCAAELCSLHLQYGWNEGQVVANALFGDGAAAAVLGDARGAKRAPWSLAASGSTLFPDTEDAMTWRVGDNGFEMTLSSRVPALIASDLRPWLTAWLASHGLGLDDVRTWAVHPGGPRILDAVTEALELTSDDTAVSREVLAEHGNMSSPTLLFITDRLMRRGAPAPCVALGFGPGLVAEAALFL